MTASLRLVLASASPARLTTLRQAGLAPEVIVSGVDESQVTAPTPAALTGRLAELKAEAVFATLEADPAALVIGCDSMLELDGRAYGKPTSAAEAKERWRGMRGRSGVLHTGHQVILGPDGAGRDGAGRDGAGRDGAGRDGAGRGGEVQRRAAVASTTVHFADLSDAEIDAYVGTGEPLQVAGAFTVDGLGGPFVTRIEGDYHNVVGLSLPLLRTLLGELGIDWPTLWSAGRR